MLDAIRRAVRRTDSWLNALTGVGLNRGRNAVVFRATASDYLDDVTLEQLYELDGLAARIVRAPCVHALRHGVIVNTGDPTVDTRIKAKLDEVDTGDEPGPDGAGGDDSDSVGALGALRRAWTWARLYGGGAAFVGADDGRDPRDPLDLNGIRSVRFVVDVDRTELIPQDWETNPLSPRFGKPRTYRLVRNSTGGGTQNALVHASRVIRFDGVEPTKRRRQTLQGWGDSVLQRVYVDLQQARGAYAAVAGLMHESSQGVFKMKDLMLMMAGDRDDTLKRRMEAMDMARSVARAILIDADGESYERVEVGSLTGLVDAMDRFTNMVSASSEIPVTVLMGQAPAGLNATGESDIRSWYDAVQAEREAMLRSRVERMVKLLLRAKDGPTGGEEPPGWKVAFPPLWQPTPSEQADLRQKVAQTDQVYQAIGALTPEEIALNRFRPDGWNPDTTVDLEARKSSMAAGAGEGEGGGEGEKTAQDSAAVDLDAVSAVIGKVAARELPRDAGVRLLARLVGDVEADATMGEAGKTFFTAPEPSHAADLAAARAEAAAARRSQMSAKAMLGRVLERNRNGELVVNPIGAGGEDIEPGDVVQVEEPEASAEPGVGGAPAADGRRDAGDAPHVAVVFPLPAAVAGRLAVPGGEPAGDLHLTLVYLGRRVLTDEERARVLGAVKAWASVRQPLPLRVGLPGRFVGADPAKGDAAFRYVSGAGLVDARASLVRALEGAGFPNASQHPAWVAHVTVAYVKRGEDSPVGDVEPVEVSMDRVALWEGDRRTEVAVGDDA